MLMFQIHVDGGYFAINDLLHWMTTKHLKTQPMLMKAGALTNIPHSLHSINNKQHTYFNSHQW